MKLITRDTDYAIRALCCIASGKNELTTAKDIVKGLKMPRPFLRKILQTLNKGGLVYSCRGRGGGFSLAVPAGKISLLDVINIFQGELTLSDHTFRKKPCPHIKTCNIKKRIDSIERYVLSELKSINIASVLKVKKRQR